MCAHLPTGLDQAESNRQLRELIKIFFINQNLMDFTFWYYTPMALKFSSHLEPALTVYDCMDELSAFKFAPDELKQLERQLFDRADVVFTGGRSLYESKRGEHPHTYFFPSSIDKEHFAQARTNDREPLDQAQCPGPKIGFYGVIDERFDIELIRGIATARPDWTIVLIGPVLKIDPATLPRNANIHYLGARPYDQLPHYLSGWDVALVAFQLNESTRFISPTKTPEYLAGGKPVVSTPIRDVVNPYGHLNLVSIARDSREFVAAIETLLKAPDRDRWLAEVDAFLKMNSWDNTCADMATAMRAARPTPERLTIRANGVYHA